MEKGIYEVLGKQLEIEVEAKQIDVFKRACQKVNQQFSEFKRFELNKADVSTLLHLVVESVQQEDGIEKISNQLEEILKD